MLCPLFFPAVIHSAKTALRLRRAMVAEVAACITGQARTLVAQQLHVSMRANLLDPLGADAFMHVAVHDTRPWGVQRASNSKELAEAARVLRPVSMQAESLLPPTASTRCAAQAAGGGGRSCLAHDCGTFSCGCYVPGCALCDVSTYLPQHTHNQRCLRLVEEHEARRGAAYSWLIKMRPDLLVPQPVPPLRELTAPLGTGPPTLCLLAGDREPSRPTMPVDDKFALMPRALARFYLNATAAFDGCYARNTTASLCTVARKGKGPPLGKDKAGAPLGKTRRLFARRQQQQQQQRPPRGQQPQLGARYGRGSRSMASAMATPGHSPYWATPQCILTHYLVTHVPDLQTVRCLPPPGIRLTRPRR